MRYKVGDMVVVKKSRDPENVNLVGTVRNVDSGWNNPYGVMFGCTYMRFSDSDIRFYHPDRDTIKVV